MKLAVFASGSGTNFENLVKQGIPITFLFTDKRDAKALARAEKLGIQSHTFALKEFGFGTRIYSRQQYNNEFESLLSCYIESGIPIIIAMENRPHGSIGHALLAVGHEKVDDAKIDGLTIVIGIAV